MTDTPTKIIVCCCGNCEAEGHDKEQVLPLTAEELAEREASAAAYELEQAQLKAEAEAVQAAKTAAHEKLAALGLTPEEIAALSK